jgi:short-subunit dehydrogenase
MLETFRQKTGLITGASAGLGAEFARQLAPLLDRLILVARRSDLLEQRREELVTLNPQLKVECWPVDLSDEASVEALASRIAGSVPDLLINNAGLGDYGSAATAEWARLRQILRVNVEALTRLTHAVLPGMQARRTGFILNVSSVAGMAPMPEFGVYGASKAYVTSFSEAVRLEVRDYGVHVTALCPGPARSEFSTVATRPGDGQAPSSPEIFRVAPEDVVRAGLEGVAANRPRVIPGTVVRTVMLTAEILPKPLQRLLLRRRVRKQTGKSATGSA